MSEKKNLSDESLDQVAGGTLVIREIEEPSSLIWYHCKKCGGDFQASITEWPSKCQCFPGTCTGTADDIVVKHNFIASK